MYSALCYLAAPLVVALLAPFAVARDFAPYAPIVLIGTVPVVYFFTLLVAMPMYFALPKSGRTKLTLLLGSAFVAGALSFLLFSMPAGAEFSQVGQTVLVKNGQLTTSGWQSVISQSLWMGALSMPGGLLFWLGVKMKVRSSSAQPHEA